METIDKILAQYDILEKNPIKMLRESGDNFVYLVGEKDKKILRISKRLPIEDARFEYEALEHLRSKGVPVIKCIRNINGEIITVADNDIVSVLFDFIEGIHAKIDKDNIPTTNQAFSAGSALAMVANAGLSFKPEAPRQRHILKELERVIANQETFINDFEGGEDFVRQVKECIEFAKNEKVPMGLIHNDFRVDNVFLDNKNNVCGIIDFDWCCIGPCIKDLALAAVEWSFVNGAPEPNLDVFNAFLDGYNTVAINKVMKDKQFYKWIMLATISDACTYFCDRLSSPDFKKKINYSYMYLKYLYFSKLVF